MPVDLTGTVCPRCGEATTGYTSLTTPDAVPDPGDISFCAGCALPVRFLEHGVEPLTNEELAELRTKASFARAELVAKMTAAIGSSGQPRPLEMTIDVPGHDDMPAHTHTVYAFPVDIDPDDDSSATEMLDTVLADISTRMLADEVRRYVTQEVANHVLSIYGNLDASMPSITISALISLIRLCNEADDDMLYELNRVEEFHGYVIAVTSLAERGEKGIYVLERIAGLREEEKDEAPAGTHVG